MKLVITLPLPEYAWHEESEVLFPIWPISIAILTPEEVYVENRDMCIKPLNVSDEVTDLKDLVSEQLFDESGESDYLQPELDEGKRAFSSKNVL